MLLAPRDFPIIRHAIIKKLDAEPGVKICDIKLRERADCVRVGIIAVLDGFDGLVVDSRFELPKQFELRHVHNEIDQIAEQYKFARRDFWSHRRTLPGIEHQVIGTGMRGLWPS